MKYFCVLFVILSVFFTANEAVKLPSYIQKCSFQDPNLNECITNQAKNVWPILSKGNKNLHFHKAAPLHIPVIDINAKGIKIHLTDCDIYGLDNATNPQINMDFNKKKLSIKVIFETCSLIGHYDIKGRILVLPISGSGPSNITFVGGDYNLQADFDIIEEKGNHFIKITDSDVPYVLKRAYFHLEDLFNGNKILGDQMNEVLNENWREVNEEIGSQIGKALGDILASVLRDFFLRVPLEELFLDFSMS